MNHVEYILLRLTGRRMSVKDIVERRGTSDTQTAL